MQDWSVTDIRCPQTHQLLNLKDSELYAQNTSYPLFHEVPWLFQSPEASFLSWATRIESYLTEEENTLKYLQVLANTHQKSLTRKRVSALLEAKQKNLHFMDKLLNDFRGHQHIPISATKQQIHSYFQLVFRDWCWESQEIQLYQNFIENNIDADTHKILILGSGAGRISYNLANKYSDKKIYGLDHNPFLTLTAKKIFDGHEVKLSDYTPYPKSLSQTSQKYTIKYPKTKYDNHQFILGSFPHLPFAPNSFDMIIAPWFFDIIDMPLDYSLNECKKFLTEKGKLISIGPSNFHHNYLEKQLSPQEITEEFEKNFENTKFYSQDVNYLNNPLTSQNRIEQVLLICSQSKTQENNISNKNQDKKIIFDPKFENFKAVNETYYHILKHINEDTDLIELAVIIQKEFQFSQEESLIYAKSFLDKIEQEL
ncbi:MAG: class I SAM-dependent methyltransferase [Bacteriovoracaceae bacterium]|jgi:ubiquinone/menaquinone biosynthesis C-methylase UbiE|nr:class I SAM-dependent methyltransferase [Bacteriovoracaceae bacterium]